MNEKPSVTLVPLKVPQPPDQAAWVQLFKNLIAARGCLAEGIEYDDGAPAGLLASEHALLGVIDYLHSSPEMRPLLDPLVRLATALRDLDRGAKPPLLAPKAINHRAPSQQAKGHAAGFAARALDRLIKAQEPAQQAAKKVERAYRVGHAFGWETISAKKILKWRERCRANETHDLPAGAAEKFHEILFVREPPPAEEAKMLLQILSEAAQRGLGA